MTRNRTKVRPLKLACQQRDVNPCGAAYDATAEHQTLPLRKSRAKLSPPTSRHASNRVGLRGAATGDVPTTPILMAALVPRRVIILDILAMLQDHVTRLENMVRWRCRLAMW